MAEPGKNYINDPGFEVPENTILVIPSAIGTDGSYKTILESMKGNVKRDWFNDHFYYCLPINIGNQYGFIVKSTKTFEMTWDGSKDNSNDILFNFIEEDLHAGQNITAGFSNGVVTIQNNFALKTPPGVNLLTIQPPNLFLPGCAAMTGVIETDQIRRDFTFNIKITVPNMVIRVNKGDALGAFIPIPRYYVDKYEVLSVLDVFPEELHQNEIADAAEFGRQRQDEDKAKPHECGRKYFRGEHALGKSFSDHQKRII
jgi:hypothetical protein